MILATLDAAAWAALAGWALVIVTLFAVAVGWQAARAANKTFRLEAEPRLLVRVVDEARVARDGLHRLSATAARGTPPTPDQIEPLGQIPIYLVDGKLGADGLRLIVNGFAIREPEPGELYKLRSQPATLWPALRIEVRNVGRSPAIQIGLNWRITGRMSNPDRASRFVAGLEVVERTDDATILLNGVGPNDSAFFWLGNATGTAFTLKLRSAYQRDPFDVESGQTKPISAIPVDTFRLTTADDQIAPEAP